MLSDDHRGHGERRGPEPRPSGQRGPERMQRRSEGSVPKTDVIRVSIKERASNARRRAAAGEFDLAQLARHAAAAGDDPRPAPPPTVITPACGGADRSDPRFDATEE